MILAIDAGNTRVKWGMCDSSGWVARGGVPNIDLVHLAESWRALPAPGRIVISNVAGQKVRSALNVLLAHWHKEPLWVMARSQECGVVNRYQVPEQLGSDRWASLIAARHLHPGACLVVSAGTAMTVDILSSGGEFLGGIITPGPELMLEGLVQKTANIRSREGRFEWIPTNTADAVYSGAMQALAGAVERIYRHVAQTQGIQPMCILGGGGAQRLQPLLAMPLRMEDNLVLEGLVRIARQ
jgi:type III pantothenate kinase